MGEGVGSEENILDHENWASGNTFLKTQRQKNGGHSNWKGDITIRFAFDLKNINFY